MSSGISTLCRAYPRLASARGGRVVARSVSSPPRLRITPRPNPISLRNPYSTSIAADVPKIDDSLVPKINEKGSGESQEHKRNQRIRDAYRRPSEERTAQKLNGPFVHSPRQYTSEKMTQRSEKECLQEARKLAGAHAIWEHNLRPGHFLVDHLDWHHIHTILKETTPRSSKDDNRVSAIRIVISSSLIESETLGRGVNFISSVTGILEKLRVDPDLKPSTEEKQSFIIRGGRKALSQAADELSKTHEGIEIFELGDVATTDYHTQMLWPTKESLSKDDQELVNRSTRDRLWLHPEPEPHWITKRFSDIPKPEKGNSQAFESYITELVCGRVRRDLVVPLYYEGYKDGFGKNIDIEADRARLILEAFEDPENKHCITNASLKRALHHLARLDGYRTHAKRLFRLAEDAGLPMDTENYNILLEGITSAEDYRDFFKCVNKMRNREFEPNARTWLLFLRLVKKDDERRQIVSSMFERNLLTHHSVRRGVAAITAPMDAYYAFKSGESLEDFIRGHNVRFGFRWYSSEALVGIVREYFRYFSHRPISALEWTFLVEQRFEGGERMDTQSMNALVDLCADNGDWVGAIWCVNHMTTHHIGLDDKTYMTLLKLACSTGNHFAFTAALFHGAHSNALFYSARQLLKSVVLSKKAKNPWRDFKIPLFTTSMAETIRTRNANSWEHIGYQIIDLYKDIERHPRLVPAEPLAISLMTALSLQHEVAALPSGEQTEAPPALEIPMKLSGDSDDAVKETFRFDTGVTLIQNGQSKSQRQLSAKSPAVEDALALDKPAEDVEEASIDQEPSSGTEDALEDMYRAAKEAHDESEAWIARAAAEADKGAPREARSSNPKSRFYESEASPFKSALNTAIPRAPDGFYGYRESYDPPLNYDAVSDVDPNELRPISKAERKTLEAIKRRGIPQPGDQDLRVYEDWMRFEAGDPTKNRPARPSALLKPWLLDEYYNKSQEQQNEDTARYLIQRYKEIKAWDHRNDMYSSRQRILMRARQQLEEMMERGEDISKPREPLEPLEPLGQDVQRSPYEHWDK